MLLLFALTSCFLIHWGSESHLDGSLSQVHREKALDISLMWRLSHELQYNIDVTRQLRQPTGAAEQQLKHPRRQYVGFLHASCRANSLYQPQKPVLVLFPVLSPEEPLSLCEATALPLTCCPAQCFSS